MAAPTTVKTRAAALLDLAWDAAEAGTLFSLPWAHEGREFNISGRRIVLSIAVSGDEGGAVAIHVTLKRP
jgi:hypothetical protein